MIEISVVVPCFNEKGNIKDIVPRLLDLFAKSKIRGEIILVNDGSCDGTRGEIEQISKQFNDVVGLNHSRNLGIAEAWYSGVRVSSGRHIVTIDADLQYHPRDIALLHREALRGNYDLVQGWRREYGDNSLFRKILSRALSRILNILFLTRLNDIKSGFVVYKRDVFLDILKDRIRYRTFQHFFILAALKKGYKIKQVPIKFYPRERGESFIRNPILFSFKVLSDIPKAFFDFRIIKKNG